MDLGPIASFWTEVIFNQWIEDFRESDGGKDLSTPANVLLASPRWLEFQAQKEKETFTGEPDLSDEVNDEVYSQRYEAVTFFTGGSIPPRRVEMELSDDLELALPFWDHLDVVDDLRLFIILPPVGFDLEKDDEASDALASAGYILPLVAMDHALLFEGFPRSFWELARDRKIWGWGDKWAWMTEVGEVVRLKKMFEKL